MICFTKLFVYFEGLLVSSILFTEYITNYVTCTNCILLCDKHHTIQYIGNKKGINQIFKFKKKVIMLELFMESFREVNFKPEMLHAEIGDSGEEASGIQQGSEEGIRKSVQWIFLW